MTASVRMPGLYVRGISQRYSSIFCSCILDIYKHSNFPACWRGMTLKLVICDGLYGCTQFVTIKIEAFARRASDDFFRGPGIDRKSPEDQAFCIEVKN